jgi:CRP-like cAMP-binding protein
MDNTCAQCEHQLCTGRVPIFADLTHDEQLEIVRLIQHAVIEKGQPVYHEGDRSDKLLIITRGSVRLFKNTLDGREQNLDILVTGDFTGELDLLGDATCSHEAVALERLLLHDLDELINKILLVHYDHDEVTLKQLHRQYALLKMDLESHFADEERALFPAILAARTPAEHEKVRQLIAQLETEHEAAGEMLKSIKTLTNDYQAPAYACPTVHVTYAKLKALTEDIFLHIHKENSVLFPRFQT